MAERPAVERAKLESWVYITLKQWREHPDFEDLLQEGMIAAWKATEANALAVKPFAASTVAKNASAWAALDFLRYRACPRLRRPELLPDPRMISFETMAAIAAERDEPDLDEGDELPHEADFMPALVETLWKAGVCAACLAGATKRQREALTLHYWEKLTLKETARVMGVAESAVAQLVQNAIERYQWEIGLIAYEERANIRRGRQASIRKAGLDLSRTCRRGHPRVPENTLTEKNGQRKCWACEQARRARYLEQRRKPKE